MAKKRMTPSTLAYSLKIAVSFGFITIILAFWQQSTYWGGIALILAAALSSWASHDAKRAFNSEKNGANVERIVVSTTLVILSLLLFYLIIYF